MPGELLPMADPLTELTTPGVFIALELKDGRKLVGTFQGWHVSPLDVAMVTLDLPNGARVYEPVSIVKAGWWAPLGYRFR